MCVCVCVCMCVCVRVCALHISECSSTRPNHTRSDTPLRSFPSINANIFSELRGKHQYTICMHRRIMLALKPLFPDRVIFTTCVEPQHHPPTSPPPRSKIMTYNPPLHCSAAWIPRPPSPVVDSHVLTVKVTLCRVGLCRRLVVIVSNTRLPSRKRSFSQFSYFLT